MVVIASQGSTDSSPDTDSSLSHELLIISCTGGMGVRLMQDCP